MSDPIRSLGVRVNDAVLAHNLQRETGAVTPMVFPYPVALEPVFVPFDPVSTVDPVPLQGVVSVRNDWCVGRLWFPLDRERGYDGVVLANWAGLDSPLGFEILLTKHGVKGYLVAAPSAIAFAVGAWQAGYPGGLVTACTDPLIDLPVCSFVADAFMPASYDSLVTAPSSFWPHLLDMQELLGPTDVLLYQLRIVAVREPWYQNIAAIHKGLRSQAATKRLDEPLFAAVIRIASTTMRVAHQAGSFIGRWTAAGQPFRQRALHEHLSQTILQGMLGCRSSHPVGKLPTASGLAHFIHPPDPALHARCRLDFLQGLPVPQELQGHPVVLGVNNDRDQAINVSYSAKKYHGHAVFVGTGGGGKSTLIGRLVPQLAAAGCGVLVIDPHGPLVDQLTGTLALPPERVVYFDPDADQAVAYNPFVGVPPAMAGGVAQDVVETLTPLLETESAIRTKHFLLNGIRGLFVLGKNLVTLSTLYAPSDGKVLRDQIIARTQDTQPSVSRFFSEDYLNYGVSAFLPLRSRLESFFAHEHVRRLFSQEENKIDIPACLRDGRVVLCKMPATGIEAGRILGGLLIGQVKHAAFARGLGERPFFLIVDEFHRFGGAAFDEIIDQATKRGLRLWLAHQTTQQVPPELSKTIFGIDTFVFRVNLPDSKKYAELFLGKVQPDVLANLPVGGVYAKVGHALANFQCLPPLPFDGARAAAMIAASRARYYTTPAPVVPVRRQPRRIDTL